MTTDIVVRWEPGQEIAEDEDNSSSRLFERARIKALADEREYVQKKTFSKWVTSHLLRVNSRVGDLYVDLRDGKLLLKLLEILSGERLPRPTKGKMRIHCLENVEKALQFLREQHVHLENLGSHDIVDGNPRLTLGLIWTIILRFQIQDIIIEEVDNKETKQAKDALLLWCQMKTAGYPNVNVRNFTTSWRDGLAFNAIIHKHRPDLIRYEQLQKSNATHNLANAFTTAEDKLGIPQLLDPEDVNVDYPDEKSIITYVVAYYHYFSRMKAETVQGKRIGKIVDSALDNERMLEEYENLTSDLLEWIKDTIMRLNEREFANSLSGVQSQLLEFNTYRTVEKPPKFVEKGNLEILLFTLQSKMRANNLKPFFPQEGKMISDINKAWERLEKAEHERELALREELIRQEKLEQLANRFDRKAGMRETWLSENQRLVSQDNFGYDLAAVEAAAKKHEAIETDILAYKERVDAVFAVADELEAENYHDIARINARKENVQRLWEYLLELLNARRMRLEMSLQLQRTFQEMIHILDWMEELKNRLMSDDFGKHLMGVEDLLQRHNVLEADIKLVRDRIDNVNSQAQKFVDDEEGYHPVDPAIIKERMQHLDAAYEELRQLADDRYNKLLESRRLWQFFWESAEEEAWIKEMEHTLSSPDLGHDLQSTQLLLNQHKTLEAEIDDHHGHLANVLQGGETLITEGHFGTTEIKQRIDDVNGMWENLLELAKYRKKRLLEAMDKYKLFADCDDVDAFMMDKFRLVASEDVGRDEANTESLLKKHDDIMDELKNYEGVVEGLHDQIQNLSPEDQTSPEVTDRLANIDRRYGELTELAKLRRQKLLDALSLYKLYNEADAVEAWVNEKEKLLDTMIPGKDADYDELAIMKHRFEGFEQETEASKPRVETVNELAAQLVEAENPHANEIVSKRDEVNQKWSELQDLSAKKRGEIQQFHSVQTFHIETEETITWINEKCKILEETQEYGDDLTGVMKLQRRMSFMERDIKAIEDKMNELEQEADRIEKEQPEEAADIRRQIEEIRVVWNGLQTLVEDREAKLAESGNLQHFLRDLDHFQNWLSKTTVAVASADQPNDLQEAEKLLQQHQAYKEEIDNYEDEYAKLKETGEQITAAQSDDPQYIFLRQRLEALNDGWEQLHQMWDKQQRYLGESLNQQVFLRDAKQADTLLNHQDNFLVKEEVPATLEQAESAVKKHEAFMNTMDANDDKINTAVMFGQRLCDENHYDADKIYKKAANIQNRQQNNRARAEDQLQNLRDQLELQRFLRECEEFGFWCQDKIIAAQDETYRSAKTVHSKWTRHQAFQAELDANKERLDKILEEGEKLKEEKPQFADQIQDRIDELKNQYVGLQDMTQDKGQQLFDANRHVLYEQSVEDVDDWMTDLESQIVTDTGTDLTSVTLLMQTQQVLESEMNVKQAQVLELESQAAHLAKLEPENIEKIEAIEAKKVAVEHKFQRLQEPLVERRKLLERKKEVFQFKRDVEDELLWIEEKIPLAANKDYGKNLYDCQRLKKRNQLLRNEIDNHEPRIVNICEVGQKLIDEGHPESEDYRAKIALLQDEWMELQNAVDDRERGLDENERAQTYFVDTAEAEAWMSEQELHMMTEDRGKDEFSCSALLKKHNNQEEVIEEYSDTIRDLGDTARQMIDEGHPLSEPVAVRQAQIDKLYAGLKDLAAERKDKLDEALKLYNLNREIDDLLQWIAEREVVAKSHELGQDFEHVCMLQERFKEFARDTESIGTERVAKGNEIADALINVGHSDAALIAQWKDQLNEAWTDLLELIDTRTQMLAASHELHKYYNDCKDVLGMILEKQNSMSDELGRDATVVSTLLRNHSGFEQDLATLATHVSSVQEKSANLQAAYAGDKAREIQNREAEVVNAWLNLQAMVDGRRVKLVDTGDLFKFFSMVRDLMLWMDDIIRQMNTQEKPRDVSGVELLMNNHQSLKNEIDAREENFDICVNLGQNLLARKHYASAEIKDKLLGLTNQRAAMMEQWEHRWEHLQLVLEVYQFARDAAVAEAWLFQQEPYLASDEYGRTLDEVEVLIKKHEAFEKSATGQEDRFTALQRLTTFELKELRRRQEEEEERKRAEQRAIEEAEERERKAREPEEPRATAEEEKDVAAAPTAAEAKESRKEKPKTVPAPAEKVEETVQAEEPASKKDKKVKRSKTEPPRKERKEPTKTRKTSWAEGGEAHMESMLMRKCDLGPGGQRSTHRSWDKVYCVLRSVQLTFFKDQKHAKQEGTTFHHEAPLDLRSAQAEVATDYTKKKHVFRLKLSNGSMYLFQAKDDNEMDFWIRTVASVRDITATPTSPSKSQTLPADSGKKEESKKRSFFTLKK